MNRRRSLNAKDKTAILTRQTGLCAACYDTIATPLIPGEWVATRAIEWDHSTPVALGNDKKPDQALCVPCHRFKTWTDIKAIAKTKRIIRKAAGLMKRKAKIPSRPFDKRLRKRMDGTIVRREG